MPTSETLRSVIDAGRTSRRLDELSAARVIGKAAQQVHAAQQKAGAGKSVGPISPAAIGLAPSGEVGLALAPVSAGGYAAPEQTSGAAGDRRSDVFSLGIVMWEALTYQRLFEAMNDAAVKVAIHEREIKPPSEVNANIPAELSAICMRALARNPADRYQSAKAMGVEIEEFLDEAGYADDDEQIAAFLRDLGQPKVEKNVALPPPTRTAGASSSPEPATASPQVAKPAAPAGGAGAALAAPSDKTTTAPGLGPSVLVTPAAATNARTANGTAPPATPLVPMPPVLPGSTIAAGAAKPDAGNNGKPEKTNGEAARAASAPGLPAATPSAPPPAAPLSQTTMGIGIMPASPASPTSAIGAPPAATATPVQSPVHAAAPSPAAPAPNAAPSSPATSAPNAPMAAGESSPHPAEVVALPGAPRESKDVLAGWGWGTDAHQAIDDEELHEPHTNSRKLLLYLIGGGVVFAAMVAVIAFGFGGSKKKHAPPPAAATQEAGSAAGLAPQAMGTANGAGSAVDTTGSAVDTTGAAATDTTGPAVAVATTGPVNPASDTAANREPTRPEPAKPDPLEPDKPARVEPAKPDKVATTETPRPAKPDNTTRLTRPDPSKPAHAETTKPTRAEPAKSVKPSKPDKATKASKGEAEASYKAGIMHFARGDTTGALASLRTSLAANPSYAPTWRGLGLVFEKLGEKDQARAAFKRYLQLAPSAGDAEQIRSRLERLGS